MARYTCLYHIFEYATVSGFIDPYSYLLTPCIALELCCFFCKGRNHEYFTRVYNRALRGYVNFKPVPNP